MQVQTMDAAKNETQPFHTVAIVVSKVETLADEEAHAAATPGSTAGAASWVKSTRLWRGANDLEAGLSNRFVISDPSSALLIGGILSLSHSIFVVVRPSVSATTSALKISCFVSMMEFRPYTISYTSLTACIQSGLHECG